MFKCISCDQNNLTAENSHMVIIYSCDNINWFPNTNSILF